MFEEYALDNTKFQNSHTGIMKVVYMSKDLLMVLFNLIDFDHSSFIRRDEFSYVVNLLLGDEQGIGDVN
ncbi:unnamed protein product [Rotaria sp. Silwood2]|nr:unnamed protein product [Rotaria sp. Silwood2]